MLQAAGPPPQMSLLGHLGLLPFFFLAGLNCLPKGVWQDLGREGFPAYSLTILAFLAGTLWGSANCIPPPGKTRRLLVSNGLAVFAVAAVLFTPPWMAALLLLAGHLALLLFERRGAPRGWYLALRTRLTLFSVASYPVYLAGFVSRG
jgi:hypothetical protein